MKTVEKLLNAKNDMKLGNHRVEHVPFSSTRRFIYFYTAICTVNDATKTFKIDNGGWDTPSTNRAINAYVRELKSMGYKEANKVPA